MSFITDIYSFCLIILLYFFLIYYLIVNNYEISEIVNKYLKLWENSGELDYISSKTFLKYLHMSTFNIFNKYFEKYGIF